MYWSLEQICRVEDINILGLVSGSVVHIQRSRTVTISPEGVLSATALGGFANLFSTKHSLICQKDEQKE